MHQEVAGRRHSLPLGLSNFPSAMQPCTDNKAKDLYKHTRHAMWEQTPLEWEIRHKELKAWCDSNYYGSCFFNKVLCWRIGQCHPKCLVTIDDYKFIVIFNECVFKLKLLFCELQIYYIWLFSGNRCEHNHNNNACREAVLYMDK